jgi:unsaturated rhamnogalacturonyl hydrolase
LREGIERLAELQDAGGAWHTILTDADSYIETSTAAFFVDILCRALRLGLVSTQECSRVVEPAMAFLRRHLREDGALDGVSYETFPSTRPDHYRSMPCGAVVPWGQGPLLTAIRSYLGFVDTEGGARTVVQDGFHAAR